MIFVKLYATLVVLSFAAGVLQVGYGMATDNLDVGDRGLGCIAGAMGGVLLGFAAVGIAALWSA